MGRIGRERALDRPNGGRLPCEGVHDAWDLAACSMGSPGTGAGSVASRTLGVAALALGIAALVAGSLTAPSLIFADVMLLFAMATARDARHAGQGSRQTVTT